MNGQREVMWSLGVTGEKLALLELSCRLEVL